MFIFGYEHMMQIWENLHDIFSNLWPGDNLFIIPTGVEFSKFNFAADTTPYDESTSQI